MALLTIFRAVQKVTFSTTAITYNQPRMVKMLQKMLNKKDHRKKVWYKNPMVQTSDRIGPNQSSGASNERKERRSQQLGVILYSYITDMINSGEVCPELVDLLPEIVRVQVLPDLSGINVFWMAVGTDLDNHIQQLLQSNAYKLRSLLTHMKLTGYIPKITFVQDLSRAQFAEVDRLLKVADFGPDYRPSNISDKLRQEPTLHRSIEHPEVTHDTENDRLEEHNNKIPHTSNESLDMNIMPQPIPDTQVELKNDVYGLNYDTLMSKVLISKQKVKFRDFDESPVSEGKIPTTVDIKKMVRLKKYVCQQQTNSDASISWEPPAPTEDVDFQEDYELDEEVDNWEYDEDRDL